MKVLLTTAPNIAVKRTPIIRISLAYIAAALREGGHKPMVLDTYLNKTTSEQFIIDVKKSDAELVGITCDVEDRFHAFEAIRLIKEKFPDKLVVIGGVLPSFCHKEILEDTPVDIVVRGEGEHSMQEIANGINWSDIAGISYKKNGKITVNPTRQFIKDINVLPDPAFDLFEIKKYPNFLKEERLSLSNRNADVPKYTANILFGRGCPYNCIFCSSKAMWNRTYRILSPERAIEQILYFTNMGVHGFSFFDDHLLLDKKWFNKFAALIKENKLDIKFKCLSRVDSIDKSIAKLLSDIGCLTITLGIENGCQKVLNLMNKGITVEGAEDAIRLLYENGIRTKGGMLINTPGETLKDISVSMKFFYKMKRLYELQGAGFPIPLQIYPGSDLERIAKEKSKLPKDFRWTQKYYSRRNILLGSNPEIPLYENNSIEDVYRFLVKEFIKNGDLHSLKSAVIYMKNYLQVPESTSS